MNIDAKDLVVGRLASFVAKKALLGENITVINCERAVITGDKKYALQKFKRDKSKSIQKGPYVPKVSERFVKRIIKRMLPFKKPRGRDALGRIICYNKSPEGLEKAETIESANVSKAPTLKFITVKEICKLMGGK